MLPMIAPLLMALAAFWGVVEQLWPSALGVPVGVQGGHDVLNLVRPLLRWDAAGRDRIELSNHTLQALSEKEAITTRRLQVQCSAFDQQQLTNMYNIQCSDYCGMRQYQVDVSSCTYTITGCSCSATCACPADYRGLIILAFENLAWVLLQLAVAICLWGSISQAGQADPIPLVGSGTGFESGVCGCFEDSWSCCCGLFCPVVRASQTLYAAKIRGFWCAMLIYSLGFLLPLFAGWQIIYFMLRFCFRMQLRQKAGLQPDCCNDLCCTFWCGPCAVCQEARHMEKALLAGQAGAKAVGGPVVVGAGV